MDGLTNQAIAYRLGINQTTMRSHVSSILGKLEVTNRTQAAMLAKQRGLV
jgi:NarL family two-component system response regulator LiaR